MKFYNKICFVVVAGFAPWGVSEAAIMSAEVRAESMGAFRSLLGSEVRPLDETVVSASSNPFVPEVIEAEVVEEQAEVLTDAELLDALSHYINPTGIFMFGGEFYLIFKEKKLKVGSDLGITFDGVEYNVTITEITGSTYRVRRGEAELQLKLK